jgi:hypothetical protein
MPLAVLLESVKAPWRWRAPEYLSRHQWQGLRQRVMDEWPERRAHSRGVSYPEARDERSERHQSKSRYHSDEEGEERTRWWRLCGFEMC